MEGGSWMCSMLLIKMEYCVRHIDGYPVKSDAERQRLLTQQAREFSVAQMSGSSLNRWFQRDAAEVATHLKKLLSQMERGTTPHLVDTSENHVNTVCVALKKVNEDNNKMEKGQAMFSCSADIRIACGCGVERQGYKYPIQAAHPLIAFTKIS
ncbi:hypothetical protein Leryth_022852 [Lithospermum erythrorhizon]|nr:hypothetical protein Leryth_022852 [Lithospermum erythrorhizon]